MAAIEAAASGTPAGGANALTQQHALIREADEYGDLFAHAAAVTVTVTADTTTQQGDRA
jgi:hypothetical protein